MVGCGGGHPAGVASHRGIPYVGFGVLFSSLAQHFTTVVFFFGGDAPGYNTQSLSSPQSEGKKARTRKHLPPSISSKVTYR